MEETEDQLDASAAVQVEEAGVRTWIIERGTPRVERLERAEEAVIDAVQGLTDKDD